jgi:hypothetical protein
MAEEDFGFYGEEAEEDKVEEIQGITENVSEFTYSSLEYPCIMFKEGFSLKNHKWKVLSNMVKSISPDKDISLYFHDNGELLKIGKISGTQVDAFLDIVGMEGVVGYYDKDTLLENDRLYTLSII